MRYEFGIRRNDYEEWDDVRCGYGHKVGNIDVVLQKRGSVDIDQTERVGLVALRVV